MQFASYSTSTRQFASPIICLALKISGMSIFVTMVVVDDSFVIGDTGSCSVSFMLLLTRRKVNPCKALRLDLPHTPNDTALQYELRLIN